MDSDPDTRRSVPGAVFLLAVAQCLGALCSDPVSPSRSRSFTEAEYVGSTELVRQRSDLAPITRVRSQTGRAFLLIDNLGAQLLVYIMYINFQCHI